VQYRCINTLLIRDRQRLGRKRTGPSFLTDDEHLRDPTGKRAGPADASLCTGAWVRVLAVGLRDTDETGAGDGGCSPWTNASGRW